MWILFLGVDHINVSCVADIPKVLTVYIYTAKWPLYCAPVL
jgi:hypothetical protein